ncbi:unnamed protein product, partial [Amoebophrya sp. A120]
ENINKDKQQQFFGNIADALRMLNYNPTTSADLMKGNYFWGSVGEAAYKQAPLPEEYKSLED